MENRGDVRACVRFRAVMVIAIATFLLTVASTAAALPPFYSAKPIRATVVDVETGHALSGVVVVAVWELKQMSGQAPRLQVSEAVTDAQGGFFIPGFGPKLRPPLMHLASKSPRLTFFKHGYVPLNLHNESRRRVERSFPNYRSMPTKTLAQGTQWFDGSPQDAVQESMWDGLTIQLEPFRGTPEEWFKHVSDTAETVVWDDAKYTHRLYETLRAERAFFKANPVTAVRPGKVDEVFLEIDARLDAK